MSKTTIIVGDCREKLRELPDASVHTCVTSPPYFGLRDYGVDGQMGLEPTPDEFVSALVGVFREVRRVLRDDGTVWLNLGDSYLPKKQLAGIPWRVAFALQSDGWYLRQDIIWHKPNTMPESVKDRCTKAHEYLFLLSRSERYYFDPDLIREPLSEVSLRQIRQFQQSGIREGIRAKALVPGLKMQGGGPCGVGGGSRGGAMNPLGRNKRSVWSVSTNNFRGAHFAMFPPDLIEPCILAGSPVGGTVLDPFNGAGTTGLVAMRHGRDYVGIELNPVYAEMARERIEADRLKVSKARSIYDASESQN